MKVPFTIYVYGKDGHTKKNPKKINEESEGETEFEARRNLWEKYRQRNYWIYTITPGESSLV